MENQVPTLEEAIEEVTCGCPGCLSVPLSTLALELEAPLVGWDEHLSLLGIRITNDHVGRRSISAVSARRLLSMSRRQVEKAAEDTARRNEELARKHPVLAGGIRLPADADPSLSAVELMLSVDAETTAKQKRQTPTEEFLLSQLGPPRKVEGRRERR